MIFNSVSFFLFLGLFLLCYWSAKPGWRNPLILLGSYVFYGWWDWRFLSLLIVSTVVDYTIGSGLESSNKTEVRKRLLRVSLFVNLGILAVFKYFNFFIDSFVELASDIGFGVTRPVLSVVLPVGISFYTFQTMSYTIDVYRNRIPATKSVLDFATYVAFFPQLVAGPIERAQRLLPQIESPESRKFPSGSRLAEATRLIAGGLVKKVVIADGVAHVANEVFEQPDTAAWHYVALGVLAFAIQIYGDFSGYSDIARGVALLLGIRLVINFTEPYLSRNITEFWRRWHISLSDWLRDYLYIPLGGNRGGTARTYRNLMLTMLLGGLWHGASWNFVIWGGLHGTALAMHRRFRGGNVDSHSATLSDAPAILGTFLFTCLAWIFFRAESLAEAFNTIKALVSFQSGRADGADFVLVLAVAILVLLTDIWQRGFSEQTSRDEFPSLRPEFAGLLLGLCVVAILVFAGGTPEPFVYFQF